MPGLGGVSAARGEREQHLPSPFSPSSASHPHPITIPIPSPSPFHPHPAGEAGGSPLGSQQLPPPRCQLGSPQFPPPDAPPARLGRGLRLSPEPGAPKPHPNQPPQTRTPVPQKPLNQHIKPPQGAPQGSQSGVPGQGCPQAPRRDGEGAAGPSTFHPNDSPGCGVGTGGPALWGGLCWGCWGPRCSPHQGPTPIPRPRCWCVCVQVLCGGCGVRAVSGEGDGSQIPVCAGSRWGGSVLPGGGLLRSGVPGAGSISSGW